MSEEQAPDTERQKQLVTALVVTHGRAKWMVPWCSSQRHKQTHRPGCVIIDSSDPVTPGYPVAIAPKRNVALSLVQTPYFAWFDDDDWSHPERLERCVRLLEACPELVAAGPINAYKIDARTLKSDAYRTKEHVIFNWSVYRTEHWKRFRFDEKLAVAEDTDWNNRGMRGQAYGVVNKILGAWLCHGENIANRASTIIFTERFPAQLHDFRAELESNPEYQR